MIKLKGRSVLHANLFYLFTGILFLFFGSLVQSREIYSGLLITEYILIFIPSILYIKIKGLSIKKTLKLNKISPKQILYVTGISIFTYPIAVFLNLIVITILTSFGNLNQTTAPIPDNPSLFLFSLFVIAITPAICEEVMFRGVMMNAYEKISKRKAIIYSAILFGIFHINIQNLVGPVLLGIIFGITVYKTNSIYAAMVGHGLNNAIALTIGYFASKAESMLSTTEAADIALDPAFFKMQLVISIVIIGVFALISYKILKRLIIGLPMGQEGELVSLRKTDSKESIEGIEEINEIQERPYKFNILHYIPIAIFFAIFLYINIKATYI